MQAHDVHVLFTDHKTAQVNSKMTIKMKLCIQRTDAQYLLLINNTSQSIDK